MGQKVQDYFDSINVEHWTAHNDEIKANCAEHVICTLKVFIGIHKCRKITGMWMCCRNWWNLTKIQNIEPLE